MIEKCIALFFFPPGPMVPGVAPTEASERLVIFQGRFDEAWRKYITYSGGEELFGLSVNEYPDLMKMKRELGLLQKLYTLYNAVISTVNGYFDILWTEIDIEKIATEVLEFQNRIRKLPKGLKVSFHSFSYTCAVICFDYRHFRWPSYS